jgi:hypothetical protein
MICYYLLRTAGLNPQVGAPSEATPTPDKNIVYPDVRDWARYCDTIPERRQAQIGSLVDKFADQGFFEIDQLTMGRISHRELTQSLGIGLGIAALIIRYAAEDIARVRAGTFRMDSA